MGIQTAENQSYTKNGTLRKRKPKVRNMYFTQDTEDAILEYINSNDEKERNQIYNERINNAFYKLSENIIHTFKFYYLDNDSLEELKHELITVLLHKLKGYDQTKGKAYSYFGTIIKRWLIVYNEKNFKKLKQNGELSEIDNNKNISNELVNDHINDEPADLNIIISKFIEAIEINIDIFFPKEKDKKVVYAIVEIFKKRKNLDIISKKAIYIYIREITGNSTPNITTIIKKLKNIYKNVSNKYIE